MQLSDTANVTFKDVVNLSFCIDTSVITFVRIAWSGTFMLLLSSLVVASKKRWRSVAVEWVVQLWALALLCFYFKDVIESTSYQDARVWQILVAAALSWLSSTFAMTALRFTTRIRSKADAVKMNLPRIPELVWRGIGGSMVISFVFGALDILFFIFIANDESFECCLIMAFVGVLIAALQELRSSENNNASIALRNYLNFLDREGQIRVQLKQLAQDKMSRIQEFVYIFDWRFDGEYKEKDKAIFRFSGDENGESYAVDIPKEDVVRYVDVIMDKEESSCNVQSEVYVRAGSYALIDRREKANGLSLLWDCIVDCRADDLEAIIKAEADINKVYSRPGGWTVLGMAVAQGFSLGVKLLLQYGADPDVRNAKGVPPVLFAVRYDNLEILELLYEAGANLCVKDALQRNALVVAAIHGSKKVVQFLLQHGVLVCEKDVIGKTALLYAQENKCGEIATMLRKASRV